MRTGVVEVDYFSLKFSDLLEADLLEIGAAVKLGSLSSDSLFPLLKILS